MLKKPILVATIAIIALFLILIPMIERMNRTTPDKPAEQALGAGMTQVSFPEQIPDNGGQSPPVVDRSLFPSLKVQVTLTDSGFRLLFDKEQSPTLEKTASSSDRVVHSVIRFDYKEDGSGHTWTRHDAVVVNPETREVRAYPLYELKTLLPGDGGLFTLIDDRNLMFVRPSLVSGRVSYDLARMDIETGEIAVIAARFWRSDLNDFNQADDFLISSDYSERADTYGNLMLTSAKGRLWHIDAASGEVGTNGEEAYRAYGDLGSKPYRELVYPSPDLTRFVHQRLDANRFEVIATDSGDPIREFSFDDSEALMDPGIVWSPDNRLFFLEYGHRDQALGVYTDNGMLLFAQKIRFYDRDGRVIRTLELPRSKDKRMNVYGWADDGKVWIEFFRANQPEDRDASKQDVAYKLYDIHTGKFTEYKVTEDSGKLQNHTIVKRHSGYSFRSLPFLIADTASRLLWLPPNDATAFWSEEQLYMQVPSEDVSFVYRWNPAERSWEWINSDPGENKNDALYFRAPDLHRHQWLIYRRDSDDSFEYVKIAKPIERNAEGLPVLPGDFTRLSGTQEWWKNNLFSKQVEELTTIRVRAIGKSRYGTLEVESQPGEIKLADGGGPRYYGDYRVEYTNRQGVKRPLPSLDDLALRLDGSSLLLMRAYEFDGFDVLLFQPDGFRFSKSFDGGVREITAYAITKQGEAFPLTFQYALGAHGARSASTILLDDNVPVQLNGDNLVIHSLLNDRNYELNLKPSMKERTLTVVEAIDRTGEYVQLSKVTNRYANRLEQALGLEDIDLPEGKIDDKQLRALFTDKAWNNPGFQHLKKDFAKSKHQGNPSRAFAWNPIDARFVSADTIRFSFALNLWYAIGLAAHLEVGLKLEDGIWKFHDLGTLETEKLEGLPGYNGLVIRDPLEL